MPAGLPPSPESERLHFPYQPHFPKVALAQSKTSEGIRIWERYICGPSQKHNKKKALK